MSQYLKAIVAAIIGAVASVVTVWQAAASDSTITSDEWQLIATTVATAVVTVAGVYLARNKAPAP